MDDLYFLCSQLCDPGRGQIVIITALHVMMCLVELIKRSI